MPARLIHRFGCMDRLFRGARTARLADIQPESAALFGLVRRRTEAQAVRDASWFAPTDDDDVHCLDLGDAEGDCPTVAAAVRSRSGRPFLLGGSVDDAVGVAVSCAPSTAIVVSSQLHAEFISRSALGPLAIGCHDLLPAAAVRAWREGGGAIVTATGPSPLSHRLGTALARYRHGERAVLVIDADALDTGYAAGSTAVNVGGLMPIEVLATVCRIAKTFAIDGMALMNLSPERDWRGHSELILAETVARCIRARKAVDLV